MYGNKFKKKYNLLFRNVTELENKLERENFIMEKKFLLVYYMNMKIVNTTYTNKKDIRLLVQFLLQDTIQNRMFLLLYINLKKRICLL